MAWRRLLGSSSGGSTDANSSDDRAASLRREVRTLEKSIAELTRRAEELERRIAVASGLLSEDSWNGTALDQLTNSSPWSELIAHAAEAVAKAPLLPSPVPHVRLTGVLTAELERALLDVIPPAAFFRALGAGAVSLRIPPKVAPLPAMVTFTYAARAFETALAPAIAARFDGSAGIPGRVSTSVESAALTRRTAPPEPGPSPAVPQIAVVIRLGSGGVAAAGTLADAYRLLPATPEPLYALEFSLPLIDRG